jgi:oligopeptide transport system substrate-binding protein
MPVIPIYIYNSKSLVHPSLKGLQPNILNYVLYKNLSLDPSLSGIKLNECFDLF